MPKGDFLDKVIDIVKRNIDTKLRTSLKNFLRHQDTLILSNIKAITQGMYSKIATTLVQDLINYSDGVGISEIVDDDLNNHLINFETEKINNLLSKYTENNFKQYSYLIFMYNRTPMKFLNVLQLVLKFYVENEIKLPGNYDFTQNELMAQFNTLFTKSKSSIKYDNIVPLLSQNLTQDFLSSIIIDDYTLSYMFRSNMAYYMDAYFNSNEYDDLINTILDNVFEYLKNDLQVSYKYDYYDNRVMVELFLMSILRRDMLSGRLFEDRESELFELFDIYVTNLTQPKLNMDQMLQRCKQYISSNIDKINLFFENILFTSVVKTMYDNHISYYLNTNI